MTMGREGRRGPELDLVPQEVQKPGYDLSLQEVPPWRPSYVGSCLPSLSLGFLPALQSWVSVILRICPLLGVQTLPSPCSLNVDCLPENILLLHPSPSAQSRQVKI